MFANKQTRIIANHEARSFCLSDLDYDCEVLEDTFYDTDEEDMNRNYVYSDLVDCVNAEDDDCFDDVVTPESHVELSQLVRDMKSRKEDHFVSTETIREVVSNNSRFVQVGENQFILNPDFAPNDNAPECFGANGASDSVHFGTTSVSEALICNVDKPKNFSRSEALIAISRHTGLNITKDVNDGTSPIKVSQLCAALYSNKVNPDYLIKNAGVNYFPCEKYSRGRCSVYPDGKDLSEYRNLLPHSGDSYYKRVPVTITKTNYGCSIVYSKEMVGILYQGKVSAILEKGVLKILHEAKTRAAFVLVYKYDRHVATLPIILNSLDSSIDTYHDVSVEHAVNIRYQFEVAKSDRVGFFQKEPFEHIDFDNVPFGVFFRSVGPKIPSRISNGAGFQMFSICDGVRWHLVTESNDFCGRPTKQIYFDSKHKPRTSLKPERGSFNTLHYVSGSHIVSRKFNNSYIDRDMSVVYTGPATMTHVRRGQFLANRSLFKSKQADLEIRRSDYHKVWASVDNVSTNVITRNGFGVTTSYSFRDVEGGVPVKQVVKHRTVLENGDTVYASDWYSERKEHFQSQYDLGPQDDLSRECVEKNPGPPLLEGQEADRALFAVRSNERGRQYVAHGDNYVVRPNLERDVEGQEHINEDEFNDRIDRWRVFAFP